ncbi:hypothetical protein GCM10009541_54120 [Micromonospora gifhornensis]|uniref:Transposase IS701-like DDE domain-containing protein n=1 Tax=Micromonospora gifhornensis TaxID=84594 RepID=A0ABQ4IKF4_9ACTN|nr:hypothetical protein Vgi01_50630 [Micromonospora gifhornensis]
MLAGVLGCFAGRFGRVEPRRVAGEFVTGLLSDLEVKTCWQLAEQAGHARPVAMQRLLYRAVWDAEAVRDDLRQLITDRFGGPDAVLVVDETGDLKKGTHTVGVQRQYTGTAGRIENSQVGVFLGYAGRDGHTLIDRRVYLPASWTDDRDRCHAAGVPDEIEFATRSELAADMITAALDAGVPAGWVAADEAYGNSAAFRAHLSAYGFGCSGRYA